MKIEGLSERERKKKRNERKSKGKKMRKGKGVGNECREVKIKRLFRLRTRAHSSLVAVAVAVAVAVTDSLLRNSEIVIFISAIEDAKCVIMFSISSTLLDRSNIVLALLLLSVFAFDGISFPLSLT